MLRRLFPDTFVLILVATMVTASILPVAGRAAVIAQMVANAAIIVLFFLHGVRLPRDEVRHGLRQWRVQGAIFAFCFGVMPVLTLLAGLVAGRAGLPAPLVLGIMFLGVLPSTVQSATAYCSMAGGRVATSVIAAAALNLAGMIVSPLLFAAMVAIMDTNVPGGGILGAQIPGAQIPGTQIPGAQMPGTQGAGAVGPGAVGPGAVGPGAVVTGPILSLALIGKIVAMLLLPFVMGQAAQRWLRPWVMRHRDVTATIDRAAIAIAVYVAFSAAVTAGVWQMVGGADLLLLGAAIAVMLAAGFGGAWLLGFWVTPDREERIAIVFAGAHKSIAVGAPLAALMLPPAQAGMLLLPTLLYHLLQLMISAWLAAHWAKTHRSSLARGGGRA